MAHIPFRNGHKFRKILALSRKLRLVSFQAKLIFQDGSECGKKVGILYMKFCSDVHTIKCLFRTKVHNEYLMLNTLWSCIVDNGYS